MLWLIDPDVIKDFIDDMRNKRVNFSTLIWVVLPLLAFAVWMIESC